MHDGPKIVVVMGAGSSADFGVPTLKGIFVNREAAAYLKSDVTLHKWLQRLFWGPRGHSASTSERSVTIEEMLTILRDWQRETSVKQLDAGELEDIRRRLYVLIYHAVYQNKSSDKGFLNGLIRVLDKSFGLVTWASFNWDCIFESSFWYSSGPPQPYQRTNPKPVIVLSGYKYPVRKHEYLKLHGSVNWWLVDGKPSYLRWGAEGELGQKWNDLSAGKTKDLPIILEPSAYKYEDVVHPLLELLGIRKAGLHAFRHTHSSLLIEQGTSPTVTGAQLGHSDPRITLAVYSHILGDAHREAVEKLSAVLDLDGPGEKHNRQHVN